MIRMFISYSSRESDLIANEFMNAILEKDSFQSRADKQISGDGFKYRGQSIAQKLYKRLTRSWRRLFTKRNSAHLPDLQKPPEWSLNQNIIDSSDFVLCIWSRGEIGSALPQKLASVEKALARVSDYMSISSGYHHEINERRSPLDDGHLKLALTSVKWCLRERNLESTQNLKASHKFEMIPMSLDLKLPGAYSLPYIQSLWNKRRVQHDMETCHRVVCNGYNIKHFSSIRRNRMRKTPSILEIQRNGVGKNFDYNRIGYLTMIRIVKSNLQTLLDMFSYNTHKIDGRWAVTHKRVLNATELTFLRESIPIPDSSVRKLECKFKMPDLYSSEEEIDAYVNHLDECLTHSSEEKEEDDLLREMFKEFQADIEAALDVDVKYLFPDSSLEKEADSAVQGLVESLKHSSNDRVTFRGKNIDTDL